MIETWFAFISVLRVIGEGCFLKKGRQHPVLELLLVLTKTRVYLSEVSLVIYFLAIKIYLLFL